MPHGLGPIFGILFLLEESLVAGFDFDIVVRHDRNFVLPGIGFIERFSTVSAPAGGSSSSATAAVRNRLFARRLEPAACWAISGGRVLTNRSAFRASDGRFVEIKKTRAGSRPLLPVRSANPRGADSGEGRVWEGARGLRQAAIMMMAHE
jgi:hypothetical protein